MKSKPSLQSTYKKLIRALYGPITDNQALNNVKHIRDHIYKRKCEMPVVASKAYPIDPNMDLDYQLSLIEDIEMNERDKEYRKLRDLDCDMNSNR